MSNSKPFPAITDCQKSTGSAFGLLLNIEMSNIRVISESTPAAIIREKKPGHFDRHVECPRCKTELWSNNSFGDEIADLRVGTLDFPSLMEPDVHIFVDSKLEWIILPEGAKAFPQDYDLKEFWPKSSLDRLDICLQKTEEMKQRNEAVALAAAAATIMSQKESSVLNSKLEAEPESEETNGEGEKTPTAVEFGEKDLEDDEAFERRFKETEKALQERLERLRLKLEEEEVTKKLGETTID